MPETKKLALLRIYQILWERSDERNPMTQQDLLTRLERDHGITADRRTVSRNLSLLREAGVELESDRRGTWLSDSARPFTEGELLLLTDSVLSSYHIPRRQTQEIIDKLAAMADPAVRSRIRRRSAVEAWEKTESKLLFYNIELITEAVEQGRQIRFQYMKHGVDKKLHPACEAVVTPCRIFLRDNRCMMLSLMEHRRGGQSTVSVNSYHVERMQDVEILPRAGVDPRRAPMFAEGFSMETLRRSFPDLRPVPFAKPKQMRVTLACTESLIDDLLETFGTNIKLERMEPTGGMPIKNPLWNVSGASRKLVKATVSTTDSAVWQFLQKHIPRAVVLSPSELAEQYLAISREMLDIMETFRNNALRAK